MNPRIAVAAGIAAVLAAAFTMPQAAFAADVNVEITPGATSKTTDAYSPNPVQANVGDKIIWTNKDSGVHTATSGDASGGPTGLFGGTLENPAIIAPSRTQEFTVTEEGDIPYYCTLHPTMVGTISVGGGNGGTQLESTVTATIEGQSFEVKATSTTSKVTAAEIVPDEKKVTLVFDTAGEAEVTLPKAMIDGITGEGVTVLENTTDATKIKVTIPEGDTEVDVLGTFVIPEFPVIAALILAVTVAGIVGYTRFAKGSTAGFRRV